MRTSCSATRSSGPASALRWGSVLLGALWLVGRGKRRPPAKSPARAASSWSTRESAPPGPQPPQHLAVHVPLPADLQIHDGLSGTRRQVVFLDGGPMHGSRVALPWGADRHPVSDADRGACLYLDSGQTRPDALGVPARVFVAQ